jgi:2-amino-4-hydroxy-6-hydroxymethyldihydropteridine diphosphokinase
VKFEEWEPYYTKILDYFNFERGQDEAAAELLASLITRDDLELLKYLCRGRPVTVCGNAPNLSRELDRISGVVFAADGAAGVLASHGIRPDAVFTDLDGAADIFIEMNRSGTIMVVHAHGDNMPLLTHWVPRLTGPMVATTQSRPLSHVYNFGGFSDGDRAVFAAHELGAREVSIIGFDCDDPNVDPVKRGKLFWARELLRLHGHEL